MRTVIAIVGFGLLIERFDASSANTFGRWTGILLIACGALLVIFAALRFRSLNARILSPQKELGFKLRFEIVFIMMNAMLVLLLVSFGLHVS